MDAAAALMNNGTHSGGAALGLGGGGDFGGTPAVGALCLALVGGVVAFALIVVEVKVVQKTSALSLSVAGNMKDVTQILLSVAIFGEHISALNIAGLCCAVTGISIYARSKVRAAAREQRARALRSPRSARRSGSGSGSGGSSRRGRATIKGEYKA